MRILSNISEVVDEYDAFLFDAFGVLIDVQGALPGAQQTLDFLNQKKKPWLIVSNGSKFPRETTAAGYRRRGLDLSDDRVLTSGMMIGEYFEQHDLKGAPTAWYGPECSKVLLENAGAELVGLDDPFEVFIVTDGGDDFLSYMGKLISAFFRAIDAGREFRMLLPNPDLLFPASEGQFGVTSGAVALLVEEALRLRYPEKNLQFEKLGKPYPMIFEKAKRITGGEKLLMFGDQLFTDIQGAVNFGIDSVLMGTGLTPQHDVAKGNISSVYAHGGHGRGGHGPTFCLPFFQKL